MRECVAVCVYRETHAYTHTDAILTTHTTTVGAFIVAVVAYLIKNTSIN